MKHVKLFINEFFWCFGWLSFFALCLYPVYAFFIKNKVELLGINGIEIVNNHLFLFDMWWMVFGAGILAFIRIKNNRKEAKKSKEITEEQAIVE